ncbi:MAG: DUF1667 domain-containing protein [Halanaerobiaceae bacterium]
MLLSRKKIICVACPKGCRVKIQAENGEIVNISGYSCKKGKDYAREEFLNPTRILPTTVRVKGGKFPLVSIKTEKPIPVNLIMKAMKKTAEIEVKAPVKCGDIVIKDILGTGVNMVATKNIEVDA